MTGETGRRVLAAGALSLIIWAALLTVTGGFAVSLASLKIASRDPIRPLVLGLLLLGSFLAVFGWRQLASDLERLFPALQIAITPAMIAIPIAVLVFGVWFGTFTASGADSYGYVSQADLWLRLGLRVPQPFVEKMPWPFADWTFAPLGYRPAPSGHAIVPTYPSGLPILMAGFKAITGSQGPYLVVPVAGALCVWLCYELGRRTVSPVVGVAAAFVFATSPGFLYQLVWPMSDIPAAAFWTAVLVFTLGESRYSSVLAGLCASMAIAIRPNLAPLAIIPFGYLVLTRRRWLAFALCVVPGVCLIAVVNWYLYGTPLASGYGAVERLYELKNGPINFVRYGRWMLMAQTPVIAFALLGLLRPPRLAAWLLGIFASAVFLAYLFYSPFDDWWYIRFLLPAMPALSILTISGAVWVLLWTPRVVQAVVFPCGLILLVAYQIGFAVDHSLLDLAHGERRYAAVGQYVAAATPPNAVLISMQHSGSLRYYGQRLTLRYDWLPPNWLDKALSVLREQGYRPFIVLDTWEVLEFRQRFGQDSNIGRLPNPPVAELDGGVMVYDPQ